MPDIKDYKSPTCGAPLKYNMVKAIRRKIINKRFVGCLL